MSKRNKQPPANPPPANPPQPSKSPSSSAAVHAPEKQPTLLAVSILLFALWFVFLLVTALFG